MKKIVLLLLCVALLPACTATPATSPEVSTAQATEPAVPGTSPIAVSDGSWDYVKDKGEFIIGLDDTFAPMGFRESDGSLVGFDIDLATAVCRQMGVEAKFQPIDWDAKDMELSTKKIDCIWNGMSITPERIESMSLTRGYLNNRIVFMCDRDVTVNTIEDLAGKKIGTQAQSAALEMLQGNAIYERVKADVSEYRTYDDVILDMETGRIDVMVVDEVLASYKNAQRAADEKFVQASVVLGDDFYAVGLRKADKDLTAQLQNAIDAVIASGEANTISEKWFGEDLVLKP